MNADPPVGRGACYTHAELRRAAMASLVGEIDALKPGNVHRFAGGHDMSYEQFVTSAEVCAPPLCEPDWPIGRRVLKAVEATQAAVGINTNLGLVLLFAPVLRAAEGSPGPKGLRGEVRKVLAALHKSDAVEVFAAIRLAKPAGLGHSPRYDVNLNPDCSLQEAMAAAAERDLVARQYVNGFEQVYEFGLARLREYERRWNSVEWAVTGCYLRFLAEFPDSHVRRKFGPDVAERVRNRSVDVSRQFEKKKNPGSAISLLLEYDKELKDARINPGTSADLTAASLLLYQLGV